MDGPLSRRRVLVTGGSGYIGRALVRRLDADGADVVNLDRLPPPDGAPGRWLAADVQQLQEDLPAVDAVIHVAGLAGGGDAQWSALWATNVEGTEAVVRAARAAGVPRVVLVSSIAVLGPSELPVGEGAPARPDSAYGRSKAEAERVARVASGTSLELVVVRPGYVFGPDHPGNFGALVGALARRRFAVPGRPDTIKAGVLLSDLARLLSWAAATTEPPPVVHAVHPDTPTLLRLCRMIATRLGVPVPPVAPEPLVRAVLPVLPRGAQESLGKLRRSSNVVSHVLAGCGLSWERRWPEALDEALDRR